MDRDRESAVEQRERFESRKAQTEKRELMESKDRCCEEGERESLARGRELDQRKKESVAVWTKGVV